MRTQLGDRDEKVRMRRQLRAHVLLVKVQSLSQL
jgi:hypothetical protein